MIWLTWRQFRPGALMMAALLAVLALALGLSGHGIADDYSSGIAMCTAQGDCSGFVQGFFDGHRTPFLLLTALVLLLPAVIGIFWGAPLLARELEGGTHRLVWNQGITRGRWVSVKLGLLGSASAAAGGLGSLAVSWWMEPIDKAAASDYPRMAPMLFAARGLVPVGYAVFAFVTGVVVGMLVRRTVPAMAITLAVFVAVQVAIPMLVRPHLFVPVKETNAVTIADLEGMMRTPEGRTRVVLDPQPPGSGAWTLSSRTLDPDRNAVSEIWLPVSAGSSCPADPAKPAQGAECIVERLDDLGYAVELTYQPASRFWRFQWAEAGIYLALSFGLAGFCLWWVRRRLA